MGYEKKLKAASILNSQGNAPKIKELKSHSDGSISMNLDLWGMDPEVLVKKKRAIESTLNLHIHKIESTKSPRFKKLRLSSDTLTNLFKFENTLQMINKPFEIVIGQTSDGPLKANIRDWPHGLIAGSTGSGKSVQMKSIIAQALYSAQKIRALNLSSVILKEDLNLAYLRASPNVSTYSGN